ncbi:MAG: prephenate dehydrogenase/arogenate dehydrogenase family protein [Vicinamibacterales bacterium]
MALDKLRNALTDVDRELLGLVARRQRIVEDIGRFKREAGQPTRDFSREKDMLQDAHRAADELQISGTVAEDLLRILIRASLTTQEQARVVEEGTGSGKRALVIGGAGKMGRWFVRFLNSQGYRVDIADPAATAEPPGAIHDWRESDLAHDIIVLATPLGVTRDLMPRLAKRRPRGLVFDIGSLKGPLRQGLLALAEAGCKVASLHPMFGPDTELLSGRHVIFVDVGAESATREVRALFASTMARQVAMSLDDHDRLIAYVLGLSHALNIAFFTALAESGEAAPRLATLSSTTFDAQLEVASQVAGENPHLYFEIQTLNEHGARALHALRQSVLRLCAVIENRDERGFVALMENGKRYLDSRQ